MIGHSTSHNSSLLAPFHLAANAIIGRTDHSLPDPPLWSARGAFLFGLFYSFINEASGRLTEVAECGHIEW